MIKDKILTIRNKQVILDKDLAKLYEVETKRLNEVVKRNIERFPDDFMFQLAKNELDLVVSQFATPQKSVFGGQLPYAFTEQGIGMLAGLLRSKKAIEVNITIMRTFVQMRKILKNNKNLFLRLDELERKQILFQEDANDKFTKLFDLMQPEKPKQKIFY